MCVDGEAGVEESPESSRYYVAATYLFIVALVHVLTAYTDKKDDTGLAWIPFFMLAMPWPRIDARLLLPGLIINSVILFLIGTLVEKFWRSMVQKSIF